MTTSIGPTEQRRRRVQPRRSKLLMKMSESTVEVRRSQLFLRGTCGMKLCCGRSKDVQYGLICPINVHQYAVNELLCHIRYIERAFCTIMRHEDFFCPLHRFTVSGRSEGFGGAPMRESTTRRRSRLPQGASRVRGSTTWTWALRTRQLREQNQ
jgi:hypothetical protein